MTHKSHLSFIKYRVLLTRARQCPICTTAYALLLPHAARHETGFLLKQNTLSLGSTPKRYVPPFCLLEQAAGVM
jgi:hypothetical protein